MAYEQSVGRRERLEHRQRAVMGDLGVREGEREREREEL